MYGEQQVDSSLIDEWAWSEARALPDSVDVAIIGGGIVGCSAAYFLAREGLRVAVFEKGRIAGEQSGRNWGWVRQQGRSEGVVLDYDAAGNLVGIDIDHASKKLDLQQLALSRWPGEVRTIAA
jgi:glycine/D-amino acid oxidase-like deaminating enzyme